MSLHQNASAESDLNLKIDLALKINQIQAQYGNDHRATADILDLLALESHESYLTTKDAAQLRVATSDLASATYDLGVEEAEGDPASDSVIAAYQGASSRIHGMIRGFARVG